MPIKTSIISTAVACAFGFVSIVAHAEKADSQKQAKIDAEYYVMTDGGKSKKLTGNVELSRGSLLIKAESGIETETEDGGGSVVLIGGASGQVMFRQKRDGGADLWIEGFADRVEYDKKTEVVKFISKAKVRYIDQKKVTQEQLAEFLSYDSLLDVFVATNSSTGKRVPGAGRASITTEPKQSKSTQN